MKGKLTWITGAGTGIGLAGAQALAQAGATVVMSGRRREVLEAEAASIVAAGGVAEVETLDVSNAADVQRVADSVLARHGRVDILVNSAGVSHIGRADNTSEEDFDRIFRINVKGVYNMLHAVVPVMRTQGGGVILNICSVAATAGLNDRFAYSMSKGAVLSMTLSVAKDYITDGIRCNCISPARVHTAFVDGFLARNYPGREAEVFERLSKSQPIGRMGRPEEIAHAALFLCSDEAGFITGCDYPVDGGFLRLNT